MAQEGSLGTILVIGGTGWLGSFIIEALLADKFFSAVVSSIEPQVTYDRHVHGAVYHDCDVSNAEQLNNLLDNVKPQVILHTLVPDFFGPPEAHYRVTYDLSKQLIAIARKHPSVHALVYTSSAEAVDLTPEDNVRPVREDQVALFSINSGPNAYARTKAAIDALVQASNTSEVHDITSGSFKNQLLTAVLRQTGHYGPRDDVTMGAMLKLVNTPNTQYQIGPNKLLHDWLHVDNSARAHVLAAKALLDPARSQKAAGQAFFISDGAPMKFWDFAHKLWGEAGDANWAPDGARKVTEIPFWVMLTAVGVIEWTFWICTFGMVRPSANRMTYEFMKTGCWFDIGKARSVLGYEPLFGTEEGLRRTVEWFRENERWYKKEL